MKTFDEYDILGYYEQELTNYYLEWNYNGLTNEEKNFKRILAQLNTLKASANLSLEENYKEDYNKKIEKLILDFSNLLSYYEKYCYCYCYHEIPPYTKMLDNFLSDTASITHLVFTNNKHPMGDLNSIDRFKFLCPFHCEKTPSLSICESQGVLYCFGCGTGYRTVTYLQNYENLTWLQTLALLSKIYYVKTTLKWTPPQELIEKYRQTLISEEFTKLLTKGIKRIEKINYKYGKNFETDIALLKYYKDLVLIERVKRKEEVSFYYTRTPSTSLPPASF